MAFPYDVQDIRVEALLGTWTDITSYVQRSDLITIRRGRMDEASTVERSTARMDINNRDGRFTPRNPTGPYYGLLNRNTQLRISIPHHVGSYLNLPGDSTADRVVALALPGHAITGDIDIRIDLELDSWRRLQQLAGRWFPSSNRSWILGIQRDGCLYLRWSPDGTSGAALTSVSTVPVPVPGGKRQAVRATLDVNNGASGHTVTFYTAGTLAGSWVQLGDPVVTAGTTAVDDAAIASLEVGSVIEQTTGPDPDAVSATVAPTVGAVYAFELRSGIGGTVVANPDFTVQTAGDTYFSDTAVPANDWNTDGEAAIDDRDYRFHGQVPAWPSRWDRSGSDVWVPIEAAGILRRLGQGSTSLPSALRRSLTTLAATQPLAYWPCEDGSSATVLASGLPGGLPMTITGDPQLATSTAFDCSAPLPSVHNSTWVGAVPYYDGFGILETRLLLSVPAAGLTDGTVLCRMVTSGRTNYYDLVYGTANNGSLTVVVHNVDWVLLGTGTTLAAGLNGHRVRVKFWTHFVSVDVEYGVDVSDIDTNVTSSVSNLVSSSTVNKITHVVVCPYGDVDEAVIGHISVHDDVTAAATGFDAVRAYAGETAGRRIERLCAEESIGFRHAGDLDDTIPMGPQIVTTLVNLLNECALTDAGILYEPRQAFGLAYRPRTSLYAQEVTCDLDYAGGELAGELTPTDDDRYLTNDVTASRRGGSSARATQDEGNLSVAAVGSYPDTLSVNPAADLYLPDIAGWQVHLGTVDEDRYPTVTVDLANPRVAADAALVAAVSAVNIGDRLTVSNLPAWVAPGQADQITQGSTEVLGNFERRLTFNTSPASAYMVATLDGGDAHLDTDGSTLYDAVTSSATSFVVHTTQASTGLKPVWTTDPTDFPIDLRLGGEVVTATAAAPLAADDFNRTVGAGGWGTASDGHTYTLTGGNASDRSVASNRGVVTLAAPTTTLRHQVVSETCGDCDVRVAVSVSATATGGPLSAAITTRYTGSSDNYRLRIEFTTSSVIRLTVTRGGTAVGSSVTTTLAYSAGTVIQARARVIGHRVLGRVWATGTQEPALWHIDETISSSTISSGQVALTAVALTGNTNTNPEIRFDDWTVETPQRVTVTRSVNGVVKAHSAGTDIRLATPPILAL
ncbi:hypothetical protein [Streptomyces sp. NPDC090022]|uniref:hypothetical protein n=1 Tax=Streptomyces sp. NPDC090022 TaxID=3365920 RepID=UPI00381500CC